METVKIDQGMRAGGWGDLSFFCSLFLALSLSVSWFCLIDSYVFQSLNSLAFLTYLLSFFFFFCSCNTTQHLCNMDMDYQNNASVLFNCCADAGLLVAAVSSCPAIELMFLVAGVTLSRIVDILHLSNTNLFQSTFLSFTPLDLIFLYLLFYFYTAVFTYGNKIWTVVLKKHR